jgi:hypothetical protein
VRRHNVTDSDGNAARSVNQNDRYGRSDVDGITGGRDLFGKLYRQSPTAPLNRVVMPSYITLKANKIAAIRPVDYIYIYIYIYI